MQDIQEQAKNLDDSFRSYAWDYFALHADQRMKAFHFYILLATAITGGFGLLVKNGDLHRWMAVFGVLLVFFSFVFWKFDQRTSTLVKHAEAALSFLDAQHNLPDENQIPHPLRLFAREAVLTSRLKLYPLTTGHFSYSRCLRWVFSIFALIGVVLTLACLFFSVA